MDHEANRIAFHSLFHDRNFTAILDDLQGETDRASAVLGAAFLDESLKHLLAASIAEGRALRSGCSDVSALWGRSVREP